MIDLNQDLDMPEDRNPRAFNVKKSKSLVSPNASRYYQNPKMIDTQHLEMLEEPSFELQSSEAKRASLAVPNSKEQTKVCLTKYKDVIPKDFNP